MRPQYSSILLLALLVSLVSLIARGQEEDPHTGFPHSRLESRQGYPDHADVISHRHVSPETHARCIQVEDHPSQAADSAACLLKYDTGEKYRLNAGKSMQFPKDGEVYLECLGSKPTRCVVGLW
jgi:hypothetical protein